MSTRIRSAGLWTLASVVAPAEFELFDENQANAVDGRGGVYAPATPIVIGEDSPGVGGLRVTALAQFDGTFECNAPSAAFNAGVTITGLAIVAGTVIAADMQSTGTLQVGGNATIGGTLTANGPFVANGASTFNADVTIGAGLLAGATILGSLAVSGDSTLNGLTTAVGGIIVSSAGVIIGDSGGLLVTGGTTLQGPVTLEVGGRIRRRVTVAGDANASYGPATTDVVFLPGSVLSANRTYTIDDTGAGNGDSILFACQTAGTWATNTIEIRRPGGTLLVASMSGLTSALNTVEVMRIGGVWELIGYGRIG